MSDPNWRHCHDEAGCKEPGINFISPCSPLSGGLLNQENVSCLLSRFEGSSRRPTPALRCQYVCRRSATAWIWFDTTEAGTTIAAIVIGGVKNLASDHPRSASGSCHASYVMQKAA